MIQVLDKGYVRLADSMGTDLTVVNAARVSFSKKSEEMRDQDKRLIKFLADHGHTSPFRHCMLQFEVKAPLLVCNQWFRYVTGAASSDPFFAWNEVSRRYVQDAPEFYIPSEWRSAPENKKQGSGPNVADNIAKSCDVDLDNTIWYALCGYEAAIKRGVCVEQARLFLPAYAMYTSWYWTASLQSVAHFLTQRLKSDAQLEIREYAKAVRQLALEKFPLSLEALCPDVISLG